MNINQALKALNRLDWFLGGATVVYGVYMQNPWIAAAGVLGLATAWYKPAERMKAKLEKKFLRKKTVASDAAKVQAEDAFYAEMLGKPAEANAPKAVLSAGDFTRALQAGQFALSANKHSIVRYEHFNLAPAATERTWA